MHCDECRQELNEFGLERLAADRQAGIQAHLLACPECAAEFAALRELWGQLDRDLEPGHDLPARFQATLRALAAERPQRAAPAPASAMGWFQSWWPTRPVWAFSYSLLLVGGGLVSGQLLPDGSLGLSLRAGQGGIVSDERLLQICPIRDPRLDAVL